MSSVFKVPQRHIPFPITFKPRKKRSQMQKKVYLLYPSYPPGMIHFNGPHIMHLPKKKKTQKQKQKPFEEEAK